MNITVSGEVEWLLNTRSGTPVATFKSFILSLPDGGAGRQIVYESLSTQWYVTKMTYLEALIVIRFPIVDQMVPNMPMQGIAQLIESPVDHTLVRRAGGATIMTSVTAPPALKWISFPRNQALAGEDLSQDEYYWDESEGDGTWVYIIDCKIDWDHNVSGSIFGVRVLGTVLLTLRLGVDNRTP